nr:PHP domain-containing protein [Haloarchaeobius salinus]
MRTFVNTHPRSVTAVETGLAARAGRWAGAEPDRRTEALLALPPVAQAVLSVELHCHSSLSYDGRDPVELLLAQAEAVGLDALAVTDHDEIDASLDAAEKAPEYGLLGIPGMEVTSADGHVLALGVEERVPEGRPFAETLDIIRGLGGIAVVPHPFQESRSGVMENITRAELATADAIEVYNSRLLTGRSNRQAERFAREYQLPMTAGSDAHISEMVGQAVTRVDPDEPTVQGILDAIREGRTTVEGKRTPWRISFRQAAGGAKRRVKNRMHEFLP